MKFSEYLKDNLAGMFISLGTWLFIAFLLLCYHTKAELVIFISIVFLTSVAVSTIWNYFRKRKFYNSLCSGISQLDKKYLISEIIEEPDFVDGKLIYNALYESGKAMSENIDIYRKTSSDFREYIELWVHEIKLPVASLLLMSHNDSENGAKYAEQLRRVDGYIENVLYYSRSESADKDYIIKSVILGSVFKNAAVKNRDELLNCGVSINTDGLEKTVMTDEKWLEFILNQLMSNSMKYFSEKREPEINVFALETPESISLHFKDNGEGISASDLPYIFDKSYTGENGHTHSRSTGMGLYIVKSLCSRLGHSISAESVKDEFTDIIITFGKNNYVKPI